ncbi:MAG: ribosomal RNA small subunit methyltransferase A [Deltaproteobacteria bacterium]|nr:ribosomal RNA small subunit methyltransferase A [Deltaproteobacteria bacterium]
MPRPKKHLGQNFLNSAPLAERIVEWAQVGPKDVVIEIGGGEGILTEALSKKARRVVAIEVDPQLCQGLRKRFESRPQVDIYEADVLSLPFSELVQAGEIPYRVVANIPYSITSPILFHLLRQWGEIRSATLMVQKEVADRLRAKPKSKEYGILSVWTQLHANIKLCARIGKWNFNPPPKVDSAILHLEPTQKYLSDEEWQRWDRILRAAFGQRRKTLGNALKGLGLAKSALEALFKKTGIDPQRRAETLSLDDFSRIVQALS